MSNNTPLLDAFLGKKLKDFRLKMRWPLKSIAFDLGVSIQQINRYEQGENKISASFLYKLAKLFNISINCFFDGFEKGSSTHLKKPAFNVLLITSDFNDDFLIRKALEDFPKKLDIYSVHDSRQALLFFRNINEGAITQFPKPDLIFLDLYLSNVKGFDILKNIKKSPTLRDIPVIIMANNITAADISSSYRLQANGLIHKSFSYEELKNQYYKTFNYWADVVTLPN